ncbi:unnamed protein product [Vitrella brassicaformis CCMP3155]|uniref:Right handed beta helix domain-containing protein n=1 Tax=Vitrella brassicaformis (strain CCMP3155) TaxID=1169540 RepID=A0A0G4GGQ7_VITBC|nr:unnamed protein product [Vitrella brassicaformis CCMP3155]|eukprot:CEM28814.1 unnamed protein product [Vitrella brassicaformis CCMP3155]
MTSVTRFPSSFFLPALALGCLALLASLSLADKPPANLRELTFGHDKKADQKPPQEHNGKDKEQNQEEKPEEPKPEAPPKADDDSEANGGCFSAVETPQFEVAECSEADRQFTVSKPDDYKSGEDAIEGSLREQLDKVSKAEGKGLFCVCLDFAGDATIKALEKFELNVDDKEVILRTPGGSKAAVTVSAAEITDGAAFEITVTNNGVLTFGGFTVADKDGLEASALAVEGDGLFQTYGMRFTGNRAIRGGSISLIETGYLDYGSTFSNNEVTTVGAAIYAQSVDKMAMEGSTLTDNRAGGSGGGIYVFNTKYELVNTKFVKNIAGGKGGAMADFSSGTSQIGQPGYLKDVTVADNEGGGVYKFGGAKQLTVNSTTFSNNKANDGDGTGALVVEGGASQLTKALQVVLSTFAGNEGGAIKTIRTTASVIASTITNNEGPAVSAEAGEIVLESTINIDNIDNMDCAVNSSSTISMFGVNMFRANGNCEDNGFNNVVLGDKDKACLGDLSDMEGVSVQVVPLDTCSPAINAGDVIPLEELPLDVAGQVRGGSPDIGAVESDKEDDSPKQKRDDKGKGKPKQEPKEDDEKPEDEQPEEDEQPKENDDGEKKSPPKKRDDDKKPSDEGDEPECDVPKCGKPPVDDEDEEDELPSEEPDLRDPDDDEEDTGPKKTTTTTTKKPPKTTTTTTTKKPPTTTTTTTTTKAPPTEPPKKCAAYIGIEYGKKGTFKAKELFPALVGKTLVKCKITGGYFPTERRELTYGSYKHYKHGGHFLSRGYHKNNYYYSQPAAPAPSYKSLSVTCGGEYVSWDCADYKSTYVFVLTYHYYMGERLRQLTWGYGSHGYHYKKHRKHGYRNKHYYKKHHGWHYKPHYGGGYYYPPTPSYPTYSEDCHVTVACA